MKVMSLSVSHISAVVVLSFLNLNMAIGASSSDQDIIGNWKMSKQYCSNGGSPALEVDGMRLSLDGKNILAQIMTSGCIVEINTPYVVSNKTVEFEVSKVSQICPDSREEIMIEPEKSLLPFQVQGNRLEVEARISILEGLCPQDGIMMVDFDRE